MKCPFCQTENRDDQERCYHCDKDLSMLRLIVNKAKHHYNQALEFAERDHLDDAIKELKNTIELDAAMVDAHLVLGTLYAKKEMFDEARAAWNQALALDHRMEKAHDYINKGESAKVVFPAMTRLYRVCIGLAGLLLITLIILGVVIRPDRDLEQVRQAVANAKDNPAALTTAFELFEHMIQDHHASQESLDFAVTLRDYIIQRWVRQIEMARMAIDYDQPGKGIQLLDKLDAENPPEQIRLAAGEIRILALRAMYKRINTLADDYYSGDAKFEDFMAEADKYLAISPETDENRAQVLTLIEDLKDYHKQTLLAEATQAVSGAATTADALLQVQDWTKRYPELGNALDSLINERLRAELERTEKEVAGLVAAKDFDTARQRLDGLKVLYRSAGQKPPADRIEAMDTAISGARGQSMLEQARQAFRDKQWEQFLNLTDDLDSMALSEVDRTQLEGMRRRAGHSFAEESWAWFNKLDPRFEIGSISEEEAAQAVGIYQRVLDNLPQPLEYSRGPILFYAASAYFKLGQVEKAAQLLAEVRQDYPGSYVMRSVENFSKKYAEELAPFEKPEEPAPAQGEEAPTPDSELTPTTATESTPSTATAQTPAPQGDETPSTTTEPADSAAPASDDGETTGA